MGWFRILLAVLLALYPLLALRLGDGISAAALVVGFSVLLLLRVLTGATVSNGQRVALLLGVLAFSILALLDPALRLFKAYPVMICLAGAGAFAASLISPPSAVERLMRRFGVQPNSIQSRYMRGVTWLWFGFFLGNALFTGYLAWFGSVQAWAYHTGFVSYLLIGGLLAGEYGYRLWFQAQLARRGSS